MLNRRHFAHIALNIAGMVLPMCVGLAVVPGLIHRLGQDRFGVLALAWTLVGYFGLLDLGLGRALTQYLAQQQSQGTSRAAQAATAKIARNIMWTLGVAWSLLLLAMTPWLTNALNTSPEIRVEMPFAWVALALAIPFLMWSTCCTGVLEARGRFEATNSVRIPAGAASFCVPWAISFYYADLRLVMAGLLAVRVCTALAFAHLARYEFTNASTPPRDGIRSLLRFGGWLTVSNMVGPMLSYFDRFAIAAVLSVAAVTHYTVAFDALTRLPAIPIAMLAVLFPMLASANVATQAQASVLRDLLNSAIRMLLGCWLPIVFGASLLGPWFLAWWVGPNLAALSLPVWQWITIGVLVNGFAHIPHTLLQSAGRTDLIAKIHLAELLPYAVALWWALAQWGIVGAAIVWTMRIVLDTSLLFICSIRSFPSEKKILQQALVWPLAASCALGLAIVGWHTSEQTASQPSWRYLCFAFAIAAVWSIYHLRHLFKENHARSS